MTIKYFCDENLQLIESLFIRIRHMEKCKKSHIDVHYRLY